MEFKFHNLPFPFGFSRKLPFPFGFSAACQIQLNCTANGTILAADFPVQSVKAGTIVVNLPAMCRRPVAALHRLFTGSFAPTSHNAILLHDCQSASSGCLIPSTMVQTHFEQLDCDTNNATISCYSETDNATSFIDYDNLTRSGCLSLFSSISMEADTDSSSVSLDVQVVRLGWWLRGECRCSRNAKCVPVSPPRGGGSLPAYRCECNEGFAGDGFIDGVGCRKARFEVPPCEKHHKRSSSKTVALIMKYVVPPFIAVVVLVIILVVLIRRRGQKGSPISADVLSVGVAWKIITQRELTQGTSSFSEINLLGKGGFGSVFKAVLADETIVAVKVFNLELEGALNSFDTESQILSTIRHRNLVRILSCCSNTQFKALILAYMPNGSLEKWLHSDNYVLDLQQRLNIAIDVALALEYLHHQHTFTVVHCDIKPNNVLLDTDMTAHVGDFGISKLFDDGKDVAHTITMATIGYAAPEYGSEGKVSTSGDVYSYGILLLEMFTSKKPTDDMFSAEMSIKEWVGKVLQENGISAVVASGLLSIEDRHFTAKEQCVSSILELAMKCLAFSPEERINMMQVAAALQKFKLTLEVAKKSQRR